MFWTLRGPGEVKTVRHFLLPRICWPPWQGGAEGPGGQAVNRTNEMTFSWEGEENLRREARPRAALRRGEGGMWELPLAWRWESLAGKKVPFER